MAAEVIYAYIQQGREVAVVKIGEYVAEVIVEPHHDLSGIKQGYTYTVRTTAEVHASSDLALAAGMDDVWKMLIAPILPPMRQA